MNNLISIYGENYFVKAYRQNIRSNQSIVLEIYSAETGEPGGVISMGFPGMKHELGSDEVAVLRLNNQCLAKTMVQAGLVVDSGKSVKSGYCTYKVIKVNPCLFSE